MRIEPTALAARSAAGFTLLEVLVAVAVLGLGLVSLLGLHVRNLALIERDQHLTEATLVARAMMTEIEVDGFPEVGRDEGDFEERYPERYPNLRWEREVVETPFTVLREVRLRVFSDERPGDDISVVYYIRRR